MNNEIATEPQSIDLHLETKEEPKVVPAEDVALPLVEDSEQQSKVNHGADQNGDARSDSEADTVVLAGNEETSTDSSRKQAIKHEGKSEIEAKPDPSTGTNTPPDHHINSNVSLKRKRVTQETSSQPVVDTNNSSNLSSTVSSPALDGRTTSRAGSESASTRSKPHDNDLPSKDGIASSRKVSSDRADEKGLPRRRKRATSSDTPDVTDRKVSRTSNARSESPPTRQRHRTQSSLSVDPQGVQKRRKPPPLQVHQRRRGSEEAYAESDDSGSAHGQPHLRRLVSGDISVMSPAKMPHKKQRDKNGRTWLARACASDEVDNAIARLKERPEDLDVADNAGNTPLQIASLEGNAEIVKVLLEAGCDTSCRNIDMDTPLIDAVENGHLDVIKLLLAAGVDPRQSNAKGEEPLDLLKPDGENYEAIKAALKEARSLDAQRRPSEDQHGQLNTGRDSVSAHSPRGSPSMPSARTPPLPGGTTRRKTARSEATRNDLLYVSATPENLRKLAGRGDSTAVSHILQMHPMDDIESVLAAAKGGHDTCLELLIAMGQTIHDPDPVQSGSYKPGYNTPMLAAIGRGHLPVIRLLLEQSKFDPTRRLYKNLTYYEIAKERQGFNWQEEYDILKQAYDKRSGRLSKDASPSKRRTGITQREVKKPKQDQSSPQPSSKPLGSEHKDRIGKKKRLSDEKKSPLGQDHDAPDRAHSKHNQHLRVPVKKDSRESSVAVSDREDTDIQRDKEKKSQRSFNDARAVHADSKDIVKPRKRLVSGKTLKDDQEKRRASLVSVASTSSQDGDRGSTGQHSITPGLKREDGTGHSRSVHLDSAKKRPRKSASPPGGQNSNLRKPSDGTKKIKRRRLDSNGNSVEHIVPEPVQPGPAKVANMTPVSQSAMSPTNNLHTPTQGAAPVAFMGNPSASLAKESANQAISPTKGATPTTRQDSTAQQEPPKKKSRIEPSVPGLPADVMDGPRDQETPPISSQDHNSEKEAEDSQEQKLKQEAIEQEAKEKAAREEARLKAQEEERARKEEEILRQEKAREEENARLEEQRRVEEAERQARLEREEEEARIEKKRKEEELQLKLLERERARKEEQERRRAEQVERERLARIQRREAEEQRRLESLPNGLKVAAQLSHDAARHPAEVAHWLPLFTATSAQIGVDSGSDEQANSERWVCNLQVAPILAVTDLDLSQCKSSSTELDFS